MEKTEDLELTDEEKQVLKLIEENEKKLSEAKSPDKPENENPDYDDYYEVQDEEPEMKLEKGQTVEQKESESEDYY